MLDKISQALPSLSNAERKVAECALAEPKWFVHAAVSEIAERAEVSQPTVIRFCRSMGNKGLPEFKLALSAVLGNQGMPFVHEELNEDDNLQTVIDKVLSNAGAAILGCRRSLSPKALDTAVQLMAKARRIEIYGMGNSGIVAQDAQHKLFRYGISTVAYVDTHIQLMAAAVLTKKDVLLVVSNSGTTIELMDTIHEAKQNGTPVIAITRAGSPIAHMADCVLAVTSSEDNALYTPMISRLLQLAVIDILAIALAFRLGETASLQLEKGKNSIRPHRKI